jgi:hypothetical protein
MLGQFFELPGRPAGCRAGAGALLPGVVSVVGAFVAVDVVDAALAMAAPPPATAPVAARVVSRVLIRMLVHLLEVRLAGTMILEPLNCVGSS